MAAGAAGPIAFRQTVNKSHYLTEWMIIIQKITHWIFSKGFSNVFLLYLLQLVLSHLIIQAD